MPYLVDPDILIAQREGQPDALALLVRLVPEGLAISIVTYMEVYQGTLRSPDPERAQAGLATFLVGKHVRSRALDLVTAAIALEHGYTLVTRNCKDYEDIPELVLYEPS